MVTRRGSRLRWDVAGYTDPGPSFVSMTWAGWLTRAERYGSPDERRIQWARRTRGARTVRAFFEHAAEARAHLGVTDNARIARRGWSWRETHELNAKIDWAGFRADDDGTGTTR